MAASAEHDKLVSMTARWFKRQGFAVVATEQSGQRAALLYLSKNVITEP